MSRIAILSDITPNNATIAQVLSGLDDDAIDDAIRNMDGRDEVARVADDDEVGDRVSIEDCEVLADPFAELF